MENSDYAGYVLDSGEANRSPQMSSPKSSESEGNGAFREAPAYLSVVLEKTVIPIADADFLRYEKLATDSRPWPSPKQADFPKTAAALRLVADGSALDGDSGQCRPRP